MTRTVWGFISVDGAARAVYYATWTCAHAERGFEVAVSIGGWGEEAASQEKRLVLLEGRFLEMGPAFCVRDAAGSRWAAHPLLGQPLVREDVISTPLAAEVFHLLDHIVADDPRIRAFILAEQTAHRKDSHGDPNAERHLPQ